MKLRIFHEPHVAAPDPAIELRAKCLALAVEVYKADANPKRSEHIPGVAERYYRFAAFGD